MNDILIGVVIGFFIGQMIKKNDQQDVPAGTNPPVGAPDTNSQSNMMGQPAQEYNGAAVGTDFTKWVA